MTETKTSNHSTEKSQCPNCGATTHKNDKKCPKCQAGIQEKTILIPKPTVATNDFLAEQIWNRKDPPQYLIHHYASCKFEQAAQIDLDEIDSKGRKIIYSPVDNDALRKGLALVPSGVTETTFTQTFSEIDDYAKKSYDSCGRDAMIKLLTRITVVSWFLDRFTTDPAYDIAGAGKFAPIIPIRGPSQSGKNRLAFILRTLSYRPYFEMSTYRIPSLYRPLDLWQGTLVLDEADFANTNEKSELVHYLNCRATGTPLSRQNPKNPKFTDTFANFGLTILTQRKPFDDNATESRALPFYSETSDKHLPVIETDEMLKEGMAFQNKLLYLRMKYHQEITIKKDSWIDELIDHRLIATLLPLMALSRYEPSLKETITETAKAVQKLKIEEKTNSMDGLLINYFWEKLSEGQFKPWQSKTHYFLDSVDIQDEAQSERLECKPLTTSDLAQHFKWSSQSIRKAIKSLNICSSGLPAFIRDGNKSHRVIFFEADRIEKRLREFVVGYVPASLFKKQSVTGVTLVTDSLHGEENKENKTKEEKYGDNSFTAYENRDSRDNRDSATQLRPLFVYWKNPSEVDCDSCNKKADYKITTSHGDLLNKCVSCLADLQRKFANAEWREHHD